MDNKKLSILEHYRKLIFFALHRFEGDNYALMSKYFTQRFIKEIENFMPLWNRRILDVGGAEGHFCKLLSDIRHCEAINIDPRPDINLYTGNKRDWIWPHTTIGVADSLPFDDNMFDVVLCRGVLEHIPNSKQQSSINEMHRVTKIKGLCYIMIPPWYNPHAGHDLKPFHYFPFKIAKFLRQMIFRSQFDSPAKSYADWNLYPITFRKMLKMVGQCHFEILTTQDTHLQLHFLTRIPVIREISVPSVAFILKKI